MDDAALYRRVTHTAENPPGGVPAGWQLVQLRVTGTYDPDHSQWWHAAAEYARCGHTLGIRRLIGAGPSVGAALTALDQRLADPLEVRLEAAKGGWDTNHKPGRIVTDP